MSFSTYYRTQIPLALLLVSERRGILPQFRLSTLSFLDACSELQAAQGRDLFSLYGAAGYEHLEGVSHADGRDEMLELEGDFSTLLRESAFLEGIRKLRALADSHQKLRLRDQLLRVHACLLRGRC